MVISVNATIRGLDEAIYRRLKAKAIEEGLNVGRALTQAMKAWMEQTSEKGRPNFKKSSLSIGARVPTKSALRLMRYFMEEKNDSFGFKLHSCPP